MPVVASVLISAAVVSNSLAANNWDPSVFIGFGDEAADTRAYGEELFGEIVLRDLQGHDGKFFFVQAIDPWLLDPSTSSALLEPPVYRSQRVLYPMLAGGLGLLGPEQIVWSLVLVNILGLALGTLAASRLARRFGGSEWWGLAFALNFGLLFDLQNDGAGIIAACLGMWAVLMLYQERYGWAIAFLAGAVLTREVMAVTVAGAAAWHWFEGRRRWALSTAALPGLVLVGWVVYVTARLGPDESSVGAFSPPFVGLVRAIPHWLESPATLVIGASVLFLMIIYTVRWARSPTALGWSFIGFVAIGLTMSERVWREPFDFARALAPLITAAILIIFVEQSSRTRSLDSAVTGVIGASESLAD